MIKSEAAELLAYAAAFDNRTVGKVDAVAWAAALHDVPLDDDATAAVARFYGTAPEKPGERLWIQPHHVRSGRLAIRKERLGETLPAYEPPQHDESGPQFVARRRAQLEAVAEGRATGRPVGALTGGPAPEVAERLAAIGRMPEGTDAAELAPEVAAIKRPGPLGHECPACKAAVGRPCRVNVGGKRRELRTPHAARKRVAVGQPAGLESPEVIAQRQASYLARLERMTADQDGEVTP